MQLKLRECKIKDIPRVIDIKKSALGPIWKKSNIPYEEDSLKEFLRKRFATDRIIVAERPHEKKILGFLHSTTYTDTVSSSKIREILTIAVDPDYFGKGVGTKLMEEEKSDAEEDEVDLMRLETLTDNRRAIEFYEDEGFQEKKKVMIKRLESQK